MSEHDAPTTSYREIAKEWLGTANRITNGWQFWLVLFLTHGIVTVWETVSPGGSTYPLWFDGLIFLICGFYLIVTWGER